MTIVLVTVFRNSMQVWKGDFFLLDHVAWSDPSVETPSKQLPKGEYVVETKYGEEEKRNLFKLEEKTSMEIFLKALGGLLYEFVTQQQLE